ncbi:hypothetical protein IKE88_00190 [Candidatus Saccharibacteria bacterium]|nr:hypothetical protein [Candidatus Saccharibacteria bacterium]
MPEEKKKVVEKTETPKVKAPISETLERVVEKIEDADNILVTLSRNPSVDEMASAIALTLALDQVGKHATAIYSGKTPNAIQFLEPENTFESDTNSLQDFIIALNKEKADHLRYKIEGDFVKVYITPYKTTISEEDLEFSRGEVNVDLIISINVTSAEDLDAALQEHGRILHDAVLINISNTTPGRIGGTEWNDNRSSSIAEMIMQLLDALKANISGDTATALLTGIIAATNRFSNERTTPDTMAASAKLMEKGADQQLISANMEPKKETQEVVAPSNEPEPDSIDADDDDTPAEESAEEPAEEPVEKPVEETSAEVPVAAADEPLNIATQNAPEPMDKPEVEPASEVAGPAASEQLSPEQELEKMISGSTAMPNASNASAPKDLMQELVDAAKENKENQANQNQEVQFNINNVEEGNEQMNGEANLNNGSVVSGEKKPLETAPDMNGVVAAVPTAEVASATVYGTDADRTGYHDGTVDPMANIEQPKDYGAMMEAALAEATPQVAPQPQPAMPQMAMPQDVPMQPVAQPAPQPVSQPAPQATISAIPTGEQNVDDMVNQMISQAQTTQPQPVAPVAPATPDGAVLPPPPMPPVDMGAMPPADPSLPPVQPTIPATPVAQPAAVPPVAEPQPVSQPVAPAVPEVPVPEAPATPAAPVAFGAQPVVPDVPQSQEQALQQAIPSVPTTPEVPATPVTSPTPVAAPAATQDPSAVSGIPTAPDGSQVQPEPLNPVVVQPVQDPASVPPVQDPGAFKIPGM